VYAEAAGGINLRPAHHIRQQKTSEWLRAARFLTESGPTGSQRTPRYRV
jgi:hypothetical protein